MAAFFSKAICYKTPSGTFLSFLACCVFHKLQFECYTNLELFVHIFQIMVHCCASDFDLSGTSTPGDPSRSSSFDEGWRHMLPKATLSILPLLPASPLPLSVNCGHSDTMSCTRRNIDENTLTLHSTVHSTIQPPPQIQRGSMSCIACYPRHLLLPSCSI